MTTTDSSNIESMKPPPEMLTGVDELTVVLIPDTIRLNCLADWEAKAESVIKTFEEAADLKHIFGERKDLDGKPPQGYTNAYQYGDNPFYFAVAYHPQCPKMGVVIKFSAHSWAAYCRKAQTNIKRFLTSIQSRFYRFRLSRIDFTIDYQNWNISVDDIYQSLINKRLEIHDCKGKINHSGITAYESNGKASTFYVGSKKTGTRLFLRIYDKKLEQIEQNGFRFQEALNTTSWVRFEAVFKGKYAHQLTDIIMQTDENKLNDLIIDKVAEKYRFYDLENEEYTDFTKALLERRKGKFRHLRLESPRNNALICSLAHLISNSGLFSTMYKCDKIWGDETSMDLLNYLHDIYMKSYTPNDDVKLWLKKHKDTLAEQSLQDDLELLRLSKKMKSADEPA
ncbi:MAG: replication initiation factor domain-containing protein [Clostridium sp.]|nr:replication initiation factor domain-containing protein [Clostridium sp.]